MRISAGEPISVTQYRALHERAAFIVREDRGLISLAGADRKEYLHGLVSNDILALQPGGASYATLLTAQGRMISDMHVFDAGDLLLISLELAVARQVAEHLERFVITEEVTVEEVTPRLRQVGLYGPQSARVLAALREQPEAPPFTFPGDELGVEGFELVVEEGRTAAFADALGRAGAVRLDAPTADVARIEAGVPRFLVDMDTSTIPLEAGIEDRAISMTKGCYVGQEVIVRVLHRGGGRVARKLVQLHVDGDAQRGDRLFGGDREVGRITSAADSPRYGTRVALAYVQRDFVPPGTALKVVTAGGERPAVVVERPR